MGIATPSPRPPPNSGYPHYSVRIPSAKLRVRGKIKYFLAKWPTTFDWADSCDVDPQLVGMLNNLGLWPNISPGFPDQISNAEAVMSLTSSLLLVECRSTKSLGSITSRCSGNEPAGIEDRTRENGGNRAYQKLPSPAPQAQRHQHYWAHYPILFPFTNLTSNAVEGSSDVSVTVVVTRVNRHGWPVRSTRVTRVDRHGFLPRSLPLLPEWRSHGFTSWKKKLQKKLQKKKKKNDRRNNRKINHVKIMYLEIYWAK